MNSFKNFNIFFYIKMNHQHLEFLNKIKNYKEYNNPFFYDLIFYLKILKFYLFSFIMILLFLQVIFKKLLKYLISLILLHYIL